MLILVVGGMVIGAIPFMMADGQLENETCCCRLAVIIELVRRTDAEKLRVLRFIGMKYSSN